MKFAYADPPYPGNAHLYPENEEINHTELIRYLTDEFPDGWALSTGSNSLYEILPLCPTTVRIGAWVKPFAVFKPNVGIAYAWEPVIFHGGRRRKRNQPTIRDWVSASITLKKGVVGAKPEAFCRRLIEIFNANSEDTITEIFPGTSLLSKIWNTILQQRVLY